MERTRKTPIDRVPDLSNAMTAKDLAQDPNLAVGLELTDTERLTKIGESIIITVVTQNGDAANRGREIIKEVIMLKVV